MIVIYFFYGLAFFTLGISLLFYPKRNSRFKLASTLSIIGLFGIFHGVNEWIDMFTLIQKPSGIPYLRTVGLIILPVSYFFLLLFGTKSLSELNRKYSALNTLPIFLFITWTIITTVSAQHYLIGNIWARYLLGIPGTFLSSYALILHLPYFKKNIPSITANIKIEASTFIFYGIFSGIIVPEAAFFPASFINDTVFMNKVSIHIQVFRTFCAIVLAYNMISILRIFNWETNELHDEIAKRKKLEQDREKLLVELEESNKALEQFAYMASHDLKSPLISISGFANLLKKEYGDTFDKNANEYIEFIVSSINRMENLINGLLAYSRIGISGSKLTTVDVNKVFVRAIANLTVDIEKNRAKITHDSLPTVFGDDVQLEQLLQNLIGNAIKFHDNESPRVHISVKQKARNWVFSVKDNGIGIASENREKIFDMFQCLNRDKYKSTGIGLAACKKIVELHGGKIWVESQLNTGSIFYFTIPIASAG